MQNHWKIALVAALGTGLYIARKQYIQLRARIRDAEKYTVFIHDKKVLDSLPTDKNKKIEQIFQKVNDELKTEFHIIPVDIKEEVAKLTDDSAIESVIRNKLVDFIKSKDSLFQQDD